MNFSGNVLQSTLDLLSTFSHQQLKTIEAALSLSHTTSNTSSTSSSGTANNFYDNHNCQTPNTWTESETTTTTIASLTDFEELDSPSAAQMNNLPKVPAGGAVGAPGAGVPPQTQAAVANPIAEYLAMQQQAQQCHQQQTQQQNQAAAAAAAAAGGQQPGGHYHLANRQFHSNQLSAGIKAGAPPSHVHGPVPPLAMTQQAPNLQQASLHQPPLIGGGQPMQQAQRQPLALTSTSSVPRPVEQPVQQQSVPSGVAQSSTATGPVNNNNNNNVTAVAPGAAAGGSTVHTTTVKLSYQQKESSTGPVPAPTTNTAAPPLPARAAQSPAGAATSPVPVLPPLHPLPIPSAQSSTPSPVAAPSAAIPLAKPQEQPKVASPQPHAPPTVSSPTKSSKAEPVERKGEGVVPPLKLVINSPTSASGGSSNSSSSSKSPVKSAAPLAIVTTPSKTSMKLATVTTPRIKQTARKNQSALQKSPTNLASISPPKVTAAPATTTPVKSASMSVPAAAAAASPDVTPPNAQKAQAEKKQVISPPVEKVAPTATTTTTPSVATPAAVTQRKRDPKAKATPGTSTAASEDRGDAGKAKRNRIRTVPYQIPTPEITLAQKLSIAASAESPLGGMASGSGKRANSRNGSGSSDSGAEDKLTLFYKNEFVAVRNAEDGFFLCQVLQNVYKSSPKIRIRWLSETKKSGVYVPDFYDVTDLECILTNVDLEKEKGEYELPKEEQTRIGNILKKAMGLLEVSEITEDNPDGLDLSIYKDEAQLDRKEEKKAKRAATTEKAGKTPKSAKKAVVAPTVSPSVTPGTPAPTQGTKRASNGVARTPKRAKAIASPVDDAMTVDSETPTRVSKRARAIQSPNYREDDDDDLPLLNAVKAASAAEVATKAATPKAPKVVPPAKAEKKVETATKTEPVGPGKKKPTPSVEQVKAVPAPVVATSSSPVAKKVTAGKGAAATSVKPGPKPKVAVKEVKKEMKEEVKAKAGVPLKATLTPKVAKKTPAKRKAEPEPVVVPEKKAEPPLSTLVSPAKKPKLGSSPQASTAISAGSGAVKKAVVVKEVKEQSLAALAESTKKAAAASAAAAGNNRSASMSPAKKQGPGSGKGRGGGRGKK